MSKNEKDQIVKRLDALIGLQIEFLHTNAKIGHGQVFKSLHDTGLSPTEIGAIVGRAGKDVSATITMYEKSLKNKGKKQSSKNSDKNNGEKND